MELQLQILQLLQLNLINLIDLHGQQASISLADYNKIITNKKGNKYLGKVSSIWVSFYHRSDYWKYR